MSNPLALLPLAIAAGGGRVDQYEAQQLVAAGFTLLQRSAPLVRALAGRRAAILLPTSPAFLTALAASEGRGAVLVNPLAAPAEIAFQCHDANVGAIFTLQAFVPRLPDGVPVVLLDDAPRVARVLADGETKEIDLGAHYGLELQGRRGAMGRDEEAAIVYTSAMAGTPLGAVLTHGNLFENAFGAVTALGLAEVDHMLALLPWSHLFGLTVTATAPLFAGGRVTTMERFNPVRAAELLAADVTVIVGVPSVFHAILGALERRGIDLRGGAARLCVCGGAALPIELQNRWIDVTGLELRQGYGLTEAGPVCLFNDVARPNVRGTLGEAFPGTEVEIFPPADYSGAVPVAPPATPPLPVGASGEICVRGGSVSPGYVRRARGGLPRRDGWLYTGDLGVRNGDGTVSFRGLVKPMFTRNGFNVYPRELERAVGEMAGVERVEVRAVPDAGKENEILLRVAGRVTEEEVRRWCAVRLSAYKQPSTVEIA